jgi:hypothetical protein
MHNVLKHQQSLIDITNSPTTPYTPGFILGFIHAYAPTFIFMDYNLPAIGHVINSSLSSTSIPTNKGKMNDEYLQHQSQSIERMASTMEVDSKQHLAPM